MLFDTYINKILEGFNIYPKTRNVNTDSGVTGSNTQGNTTGMLNDVSLNAVKSISGNLLPTKKELTKKNKRFKGQHKLPKGKQAK